MGRLEDETHPKKMMEKKTNLNVENDSNKQCGQDYTTK